VDIATTQRDFAALSYGGVPDWGVGCALTAEHRIVVLSPGVVRGPYDLRTLLRHELAHVAVQDVLRSAWAPRWFHEGVASAVAGEWRLEESAALAMGAWRGTLIRPSELDQGFPQSARMARVAYAESYQAVLLLERLAGVDDVAELVGLVAAAPSFDEALRRITGGDVRSFDTLVLDHLRKRFGLALLLSRGNVLFLGAALLVIAGALTRRHRSRARLARWEREERSGEDRAGGGAGGGTWR
jgi:hypothetical protein